MTGSERQILIAGIGNIFLGDDAFGVCVIRELAQRHWPDTVRVVDFGIRGLDLAYALDGCAMAILVDAAPRGGVPGTLYVIEPEVPDGAESAAEPELVEAHSMDPARVLRLVRSMGGRLGKVLVVGCEPAPLDPAQDMQMELSPAVRAAIMPAVHLVESLVAKYLTQPAMMEDQHASDHIGRPG